MQGPMSHESRIKRDAFRHLVRWWYQGLGRETIDQASSPNVDRQTLKGVLVPLDSWNIQIVNSILNFEDGIYTVT